MLLKLIYALKNKKFAKLACVFLSFFSILGCHAMKKYPPENFFHGTQLILAQDIYNNDVDAVIAHASSTNLNKPGKEDMTILFYAFQSAADKKEAQLKIISELVKSGADPLQRVPDMGSVAGVAANADSPLYMQALLNGGMDANVKIMSTPVLMMAVDDERIPTMDLLIKKGANVDQRDSLGSTALMAALDSLQLDAVSWLLDHGADPGLIETNSGWSFSRQLASLQKKVEGNNKAEKKIQDIIEKCVAKGMEWPPKKK